MARIALVTGAAEGMGGIAEAVCLRLAALAYRAVITYSPAKGRPQAWLAAMESRGYRFGAYPCDILDHASAQRCIAHIEEEIGPVDVLVNNAGVTRGGLCENSDQESRNNLLQSDLHAACNMSMAVLDGMTERGWGRIITIASAHTQQGVFGQAGDPATKAGIHDFIQALVPAQEAARKGVTINTVSPGYIGTQMASLQEDAHETHTSQTPAPHLGTAEEVAGLVAYLASDEAFFISGANIAINGAQHVS